MFMTSVLRPMLLKSLLEEISTTTQDTLNPTVTKPLSDLSLNMHLQYKHLTRR